MQVGDGKRHGAHLLRHVQPRLPPRVPRACAGGGAWGDWSCFNCKLERLAACCVCGMQDETHATLALCDTPDCPHFGACHIECMPPSLRPPRLARLALPPTSDSDSDPTAGAARRRRRSAGAGAAPAAPPEVARRMERSQGAAAGALAPRRPQAVLGHQQLALVLPRLCDRTRAVGRRAAPLRHCATRSSPDAAGRRRTAAPPRARQDGGRRRPHRRHGCGGGGGGAAGGLAGSAVAPPVVRTELARAPQGLQAVLRAVP